MHSSSVLSTLCLLAGLASGVILQNGQVRITNCPNTRYEKGDRISDAFRIYPPDAPELSYKGRWDDKHISYLSTPGLKFGFTGTEVAIEFGNYTSFGVLIAYRINGLDWQMTNFSQATHLLINRNTPRVNLTIPISPSVFEMPVTNWAYGVQISNVLVGKGEKLIKIPDFDRRIEFIGDSLSAGMYGTFEGLSGFAYGTGAGLGSTEYSITAYPGIYTGYRATNLYGDNAPDWDFSKHPAADIVVINIGTSDANAHNNVSTTSYVAQYTMLIEGIHAMWPKAQIVLISLWEGWDNLGNTYQQSRKGFVSEIHSIYTYFNNPAYLTTPIAYSHTTNSTYSQNSSSQPFVHYFNSTGLLQHNDNGPQYHPTDVGYIRMATALIQYIRMKFDWVLYATGQEVQHQTLYWNDEQNY